VVARDEVAKASATRVSSGDVFHAAFAFGLLQGWGKATVLRTANAAAALSCRALGAQGGLPDRPAVEAFLAAAEARGGGRR
jgi:sugar/nucleoside kinase (ribokinase family)